MCLRSGVGTGVRLGGSVGHLPYGARMDVGIDAERWARVLAETDRLAEAGATVLGTVADHHVGMAVPEGDEFCVAAASTS